MPVLLVLHRVKDNRDILEIEMTSLVTPATIAWFWPSPFFFVRYFRQSSSGSWVPDDESEIGSSLGNRMNWLACLTHHLQQRVATRDGDPHSATGRPHHRKVPVSPRIYNFPSSSSPVSPPKPTTPHCPTTLCVTAISCDVAASLTRPNSLSRHA